MTAGRSRVPVSAAHWHAAGVRHAVLLRVLPALRHDVATPISVMRLTASVLQRKLAHEPVDAAYCSQRVETLDQQISVLNDALRWLLDWGAGASDSPVTRAQLAFGCVGLLQPLWALEGVMINLDPALQPLPAAAVPSIGSVDPRATEVIWSRQSALRYLLLAALCYVHDSGSGPVRIRVVPDRHDALQLHGTLRNAGDLYVDPSTCQAEPQQPPVCIDAAALACLAADLGYLVRFNHDGVWLQLADRRSGSDRGADADTARAASR